MRYWLPVNDGPRGADGNAIPRGTRPARRRAAEATREGRCLLESVRPPLGSIRKVLRISADATYWATGFAEFCASDRGFSLDRISSLG